MVLALSSVSSALRMPSFLHGIYPSVRRNTQAYGRQCGEQYQKDGSFRVPRKLLEVPPGEVVIAHEVVDFQRERTAWRLYMVSNILGGVYDVLGLQNPYPARDAYEAFCRETAWGALHFAIEPMGPVSAERTAARLQAVLRFWEPLRTVRYLFKRLGTPLTLEELMTAACDWAMDAWCPVGEADVRARLEKAAERMARATREESLEAILRQMPRALALARGLKHRDVLADPMFQRRRFDELEPLLFERVSAACTGDLLERAYAWDRQLERQ